MSKIRQTLQLLADASLSARQVAAALGISKSSRSTLITRQMPSDAWHQWLGEPTIADAIMDRLMHASHSIALKGESLRRASSALIADS